MTTEIIVLIFISFTLGFAVAALVFFIVCRKLIKANHLFHKQEGVLKKTNDNLVEYINYIYETTNEVIDFVNKRDGQNFTKLEHFPFLSECEVTYESGAHK